MADRGPQRRARAGARELRDRSHSRERERELGGGVLTRGRDFSASRIATRTMAQSGGRKRRGVGERAREGEAGFVNVTLPSQFLYATSEAEEDGEGTRHLSVDPTGRWPEGS